MVAGTLVLAITAMFATKANRKFAAVTTAQISGVSDFFVYVPTGLLTSLSGTHIAYARLITGGGTKTIFKGELFTKNGVQAVYYK
jgi:hypothetical protein